MGTSETVDQHLRALEELLLQPGTRRDAQQVTSLLSEAAVNAAADGVDLGISN